MHVVATAGHVDHGKSTLVRALTGQDPDRLEAERRRGLSIQLGYCWTRLSGVGDVAFVDVPGHERFIGTTLAGLGPVPAALLVVAADDPWMPQAAEHLAALDALHVEHGLLVVTRCDLADPGPALERASVELARTSLRGARAVTVSGRTGHGLDTLRSELAILLGQLPPTDPTAAVRLWVDRSFHVRGTGTVVTGTLPAGTIRVGDVLESAGREVRVRSIQSLGQRATSAHGVSRVALALAGKAADEIGRGSVLVTPGAFEYADVVDVDLTGEGPVSERPLLHLGATSQSVHVRPLSSGFVRLRLDPPLPLRIGDRALLRDPGSRRLWGLRVVDPAPPPLRRRGAATARGRELSSVDGSLKVEVERRGIVDRTLLARLGATGAAPPDALAVERWLVSRTRAGVLRDELVRYVEHHSRPHRPGVPVSRVAGALDLPSEQLVSALVEDPWQVCRGLVEPISATLPPRLDLGLQAIGDDLATHAFSAPDADRLADLALTAADLAVLANAGHLLRLADGIVLLPGADEQALQMLSGLDQPFTVSQARVRLGTSRRVVLPLLAHLDRTGRTARMPDDRRRVRG